jgi:hypothetical protein
MKFFSTQTFNSAAAVTAVCYQALPPMAGLFLYAF